jgi:hypothetical protein
MTTAEETARQIDREARELADAAKRRMRWFDNMVGIDPKAFESARVGTRYGPVAFIGIKAAQTASEDGVVRVPIPFHFALMGVARAGKTPEEVTRFMAVMDRTALLLCGDRSGQEIVVTTNTLWLDAPKIVTPGFRTPEPGNYTLAWMHHSAKPWQRVPDEGPTPAR